MASISHAKEERRRDRRRQIRVEAHLNGERVKVVDISAAGVGGFLAVHFAGDFASSIGMPARLTLKTPSGTEQEFTVELIRATEGAGLFGARFLGLDDAQYSMVEKLLLGRAI